MTCARGGVVAAVTPLLARGTDVNATEASRGQTALMWAAWEGHTEVVSALLEHGADVLARSTTGYSALLLAAREGYLDTTQALLTSGADVNDAAEDGTTALVVATIRGHTTYAEFLLDEGADPNLGPGFAPLHWAAGVFGYGAERFLQRHHIRRHRMECLRRAAGGGATCLCEVRLAHGANPNARTRRTPGFGIRVKSHVGNMSGGTAFLIAARANDVDVMRELLAHCADPLVPTRNGTTPLMMAAGVGHEPGITRSTERDALRAVTLCCGAGRGRQRGQREWRHSAARRRVEGTRRFDRPVSGRPRRRSECEEQQRLDTPGHRRGCPYRWQLQSLGDDRRAASDVGCRSQSARHIEGTAGTIERYASQTRSSTSPVTSTRSGAGRV